eukprot:5139067-Lingulodinium_polyedra.AAC.1
MGYESAFLDDQRALDAIRVGRARSGLAARLRLHSRRAFAPPAPNYGSDVKVSPGPRGGLLRAKLERHALARGLCLATDCSKD